MTDHRGSAIAKCRDLERRCIRVGHEIGQRWAHDWANDLLDKRLPGTFYDYWIAELAGFVERKEARAVLEAPHG